MIPCLFQLNFVFFLPAYVLFQAFRFLRPVNGPRIRLQILQFTLPYLRLLACTYLRLLIYTCVLVTVLYELDNIDKMWEI